MYLVDLKRNIIIWMMFVLELKKRIFIFKKITINKKVDLLDCLLVEKEITNNHITILENLEITVSEKNKLINFNNRSN